MAKHRAPLCVHGPSFAGRIAIVLLCLLRLGVARAGVAEDIREQIEDIRKSKWAGGYTAQASGVLLKTVAEIEGELPAHYRDDLRRTLLARLAQVKKEGDAAISPEYADLLTANQFLGRAENTFLLPYRPLPTDPAERKKAIDQYEKLVETFRTYVTSHNGDMHEREAEEILVVILGMLERVRDDMFTWGFAQPLTPEQYLSLQSDLQKAVDKVIKLSAGPGVPERPHSFMISQVIQDASKELRTFLKEVEGKPSWKYRSKMKKWHRDNRELFERVSNRLGSASQKEVQLNIERGQKTAEQFRIKDNPARIEQEQRTEPKQ